MEKVDFAHVCHRSPQINAFYYQPTFVMCHVCHVSPQMNVSRLEVGENEKPRDVYMYSTVPIVCPPGHVHTCELKVELDPINNNSE